jgi:hypothetical protein
MVIVGRIGKALAASGIAFSLNMVVFMPMVGLAVGVSSLVGRYLGAEKPELAERVVYSAFGMSLAYMSACGLLYVLGARLLLAPYAAGADPATFEGVAAIATVLLRFVAVYSIFDMMNLSRGRAEAPAIPHPPGPTWPCPGRCWRYVAACSRGGSMAWSAASACVIPPGLSWCALPGAQWNAADHRGAGPGASGVAQPRPTLTPRAPRP